MEWLAVRKTLHQLFNRCFLNPNASWPDPPAFVRFRDDGQARAARRLLMFEKED